MDDHEDKDDLSIEENSFQIFENRLKEEDYHFYLSQYQGLFIKSFLLAYRNFSFLLFLLLIPFLILYFLNEKKNNSILVFPFDDWSHLEKHNVYIALNQITNPQFIQQLKNLIKQRSPLTNLILLYNITDIEQLNDLLFSILILRCYEERKINNNLFRTS